LLNRHTDAQGSQHREKGKYMVLSNDGHGDLPKRHIEEGLARGALVHCGFDNDAGGNKLWQQVKEAYPRRGHRTRAAPGRGQGLERRAARRA